MSFTAVNKTSGKSLTEGWWDVFPDPGESVPEIKLVGHVTQKFS